MKNRVIVFFASLLMLVVTNSGRGSGTGTPRLSHVNFKDWPQAKFGDIRLLIASRPQLANQGFAGARPGEMKNTLMIFPNLPDGVSFTNTDQGYGPVVADLTIVYFDRNFRILKSEVMKAETGHSTAPRGAAMAIEGLAN